MRNETSLSFIGSISCIACAAILVAGSSTFASSSAAAAALRNAERAVRYKHEALGGDDPRFMFEPVVTGLTGPTSFDFLPDGRLIFAEKFGLVRIARDGVLLPQPALDLRAVVNDRFQSGLLAVTADPDFIRNGFLYLGYAADEKSQHEPDSGESGAKVVRYTLVDDRIDPSSAFVLVDDFSGLGKYHSVGAIRFGPDGMLFVSFGDGSDSNYAEYARTYVSDDLDSINGKILRIDPRTGAGPSDNPFFEPHAPRSARSRTWAYGLRHPFRFAVHARSGVPYAGDVGLHKYESIVRAAAGARFGWPCLDAIQPHPFARFLRHCDDFRASTSAAKDVVYGHDRASAAVIAGDFNLGPKQSFPSDTYGEFFFADFVRGWLKRASLDADGRLVRVRSVSTKAGAVVEMRFGADGHLYVLSYGAGSLQRLRPIKGM